jgi:hypothetical protein
VENRGQTPSPSAALLDVRNPFVDDGLQHYPIPQRRRPREHPTGCTTAARSARHLSIRRSYRLMGNCILGISNDSPCQPKAPDAGTETIGPPMPHSQSAPSLLRMYVVLVSQMRNRHTQARSLAWVIRSTQCHRETSEQQWWPNRKDPEHPGIPTRALRAHILPVPRRPWDIPIGATPCIPTSFLLRGSFLTLRSPPVNR